MVKNLLQKVYDVPGSVWFLAFALGVIAAQLFALAWLADGQVKRANDRDQAANASRVVLAQCIERNSPERLNQCLLGTGNTGASGTEKVWDTDNSVASNSGKNAGGMDSRAVHQVAFVR